MINKGLDIICNGIINGEEFIYPQRKFSNLQYLQGNQMFEIRIHKISMHTLLQK